MCLFSGQLDRVVSIHVVVTTYTPLSPTRTRLRSEYYFDREIAETRRDYVEIGLAVLDEVTGEDQRGRRDAAKRPPRALRPRRQLRRAPISCRWSRACGGSTIVCEESQKTMSGDKGWINFLYAAVVLHLSAH